MIFQPVKMYLEIIRRKKLLRKLFEKFFEMFLEILFLEY